MGDLPPFESLEDYAAELFRIATCAAVKAVTPHLSSDATGLPLPLPGAPLLSNNAPPETKDAAFFLWAMVELERARDAGDMMSAITAAFVAGAATTGSWLAGTKGKTLVGLVELLDREQARRQRGGQATRALTPEQQVLATRIIAEQQTSGVSKTAACTRAAAKLAKDHGIEVSKDTLLRLLRVSPS